tara:strand:+ start:20058 stop:20246 length:189 start_codon:yes stop_codon:yes gene_type:complete
MSDEYCRFGGVHDWSDPHFIEKQDICSPSGTFIRACRCGAVSVFKGDPGNGKAKWVTQEVDE